MKATALLCVLVVFLVSSVGSADISPYMSYQGVLRDGSGNPVPDGDYSVSFSIYDAETGGSVLWRETQTLAAEDGIINATLGTVTSMSGLAFDVPYWLGIAVEGETELVPRTELTTVPYAAHAGVADVALASDDDWQFDGEIIYRETGMVAIRHDAPSAPLDVVAGDETAAEFENSSAGLGFTVMSVNSSGTAGGFFSGLSPGSYPGTPAAVYGRGGAGARGGHFTSDGDVGLFAECQSGRAIMGYSSLGHSGYFAGGGLGVYVDDQLETNGFRMSPGASYGYVLTSDGSGVGTWQAAAAVPDGDWTVAADDIYLTPTGRVGIGLSLPTAKLEVYNDTNEEALEVKYGGTTAGRAVNMEMTTTPASGRDVLELRVPADAPDDCQLLEGQRGVTVNFAVDADGFVSSAGGGAFSDALTVESDQAEVGKFTATTPDSTTRAVSGVVSGSGSVDATGVYGYSVPEDGYGVGGSFEGGATGVEGLVFPAWDGPDDAYYGVHGFADGGEADNIGISGYARDGYNNYGIYGHASGATNADYAGYFYGDVHIIGTLTGGKAGMKIDHPLDPAGSYLEHAYVGSDELLNVYSGNVMLDAGGEATVELPEWFEALNGDIRYQLTAVRAPGPSLYVAQKVANGAFRIAGGEPGSEVSWQVTGVRRDLYAEEVGFEAEHRKASHDAGKYAHPEVRGMPRSAGIGYVEPPKAGRAVSGPKRDVRPRRNRADGDE
ncbi:MAG: hypothetical protein GF400_06695 [Candidatus Eisenbacteria bacterium]|nr:hypothetical protein [Candidatus Eisenbacteria bacterium]